MECELCLRVRSSTHSQKLYIRINTMYWQYKPKKKVCWHTYSNIYYPRADFVSITYIAYFDFSNKNTFDVP